MNNNSKVKSCKNKLQDLPKIGIRPTIDGRRGGVRESLEGQTMNMAKITAEFLTNSLKYPNGKNIECVISDSCIGGVAEAVKAAQKFRLENVGLTITVTQCWCYGSETMDMDPFMPKAVWGFNGTERPGAVYLAALNAAHNQKGLPIYSIYGKDVQDAGSTTIPGDVKQKILNFAKSGLAVSIMKNKSYLSIGGVSMGIAGSIINPDFFERYLGMRIEYKDMSEILRRIERKIYDEQEYQIALQWVKKYCKEGPDNNPKSLQKLRAEKDKDWETCVKMTLIIKDMMTGNPELNVLGFGEESLGHNAIAAGFQGQRHWTDHFPNGDFSETILNSSFDWTGTRMPYILATENDCLNGIAMLMGFLITNTAQIFADVRTYWSPEAIKRVTGYSVEGIGSSGLIHLINSGSAAIDGIGIPDKNGKPEIKPFWEVKEKEIEKLLDRVLFRPAEIEYFRGGGFSTDYLTHGGMPVTMSRINIIYGIGPVLQIAEGYTVGLPENIHKILDERTNPTWPSTWFAPIITGRGAFTDTYTVMNNWGANHSSVSYGHIGSTLITLASMLRIPVCMHNIAEEKIFRPSAWNAFGTSDPEGADFRSCKNFGPLY